MTDQGQRLSSGLHAAIARIPYMRSDELGAAAGVIGFDLTISAGTWEVVGVIKTSISAARLAPRVAAIAAETEGVAIAAETEIAPLSSLKPTHYITKSENAMKKFVRGVQADGGIQESIKYVEDNGANYIVDGHHRYFAAQKLGISQVLVQQVQLPYLGYRTSTDLILSGKQPVWWRYFKP